MSNDPSVVYEDFLFQPGTNITGFQIDLDGFYGDGAGLHQVTLLSTGGVALADSSNSSASCNTGVAAASSTSSSTQNGDWTSTTVTSSISGVTESALVAPVDAGTTQDDSPSVTFRPSIVSATAYDVYLITPGCAAMGDCISRTSVEIATDSGTGTAHSATVSQTNEQEQSALVYSGDLSPDASFTLRLASGADGSSSGDSYSLVAYKLQVVAQDTSASRIADTPGRAIYEYVLPGSTGAFGDGQAAASSNTNITANAITNATAFDQLAASLNHTATSVHALVFSDSTVYFGGAFNSSDNVTTANIASFNGDLDAEPVVPNRGLNGPVRALLIIDDHLYAAGSFNATADGSIDELNGLAKWKVGSSDSWAALQGGDVPRFTEVVGLAPTKIEDDDALLAVAQQSDSADSAALGIYNIRSERWDASALPFIAGSSSAVAASAVDEGSIYFTGRITQALSSSASGASRLTTNSSGYPTLDSYGFDFSANADGASSTSTRQQKRATRTYNVFSKRATTEVTGLPTPISNDANAQILAGAFYKNGSDDLTILGGRYQTEESVSNIGIYNSDSQSLSPLASDNPIDGVVRALRVVDDTLWIGGQFTAQDGSIGLTRYELDNGKWSSFSSPVQGPSASLFSRIHFQN